MKFTQLAVTLLGVTSQISAFTFMEKKMVSASASTSASSVLKATPPSKSEFLTAETAKNCIDLAGSPVYVYSAAKLEESADKCLAFPNAYGLTVRYAMKASPNVAILQLFMKKGIHIDASSGYEVRRAMKAGVPPEHISLSTQELPEDFAELVDLGVKVNAW